MRKTTVGKKSAREETSRRDNDSKTKPPKKVLEIQGAIRRAQEHKNNPREAPKSTKKEPKRANRAKRERKERERAKSTKRERKKSDVGCGMRAVWAV